MRKLLKYEIIRESRSMLILLAILSIGNIFLMTRMGSWDGDLIAGLLFLIDFTALVVAMCIPLNIFSKDIYDDSGYLTNTLPISGYTKVGVNLILTILNMLVMIIICIVYGLIFIKIQSEINWGLMTLDSWETTVVISFMIEGFLMFLAFIISIYFAVVLTRFIFKKIRMEKLISIGVWIALNIGVTWIMEKINYLFPWTITLSNVPNTKIMKADIDFFGIIISGSRKAFELNITLNILTIVVGVAMFILTARLLDEKIDI